MTGCSRRRLAGGAAVEAPLSVGSQITEADWRLFPLWPFRRRLFLAVQCNRQRTPTIRTSELHARALSGAGRRRDRDAALLRHQLLFDPQGEPDPIIPKERRSTSASARPGAVAA